MTAEPAKKTVRHLRQILLWPVYLQPLDETAPVQDHWEQLAMPAPGNPWREVVDEFGDPAEFQERHYNEFVSFLPPVQRFLYGQGLGRAVRRTYGESPIKVMRRSDIATARVTLDQGTRPLDLSIAHVDLYFFFDIDIVLLALEIFADDVPLEVAHETLFRFGRAYPAFWEASGRGGHCPWRVEWLSATGEVLAASDYEKREKYLTFVCQHRAPAVSSHWEYLLAPLVLNHSDKKGDLRYRQLEYFRMPYMVLLAMDDPRELERSELVRLALGTPPGEPGELPYAESYLADFEARICYDRYCDLRPLADWQGARFMATGLTLVVLGQAQDAFFMNPEGGFLGRFRHQHFLLFLIAHFQKAALRMYSDKLVASVSRLDITEPETVRVFRRSIRHALENFLRFEHRYWFLEISNNAQVRDLFEMTRRHLNLDAIYAEVREELQDMSNFLDVEAMRRQNETVVRLTVVTIFGLVGTVTTGFLGMNLFAWADEPAWWRFAMLTLVFVPTLALTFYTVMKSRRLSEFLDELSDERASLAERARALLRVWMRKS